MVSLQLFALAALGLCAAFDEEPIDFVKSAIAFDGSMGSAWQAAAQPRGGGATGGGAGAAAGGGGGSGAGSSGASHESAKPGPPLLPAGRVLQLPSAVNARSIALGSHRGVVYITDGALHNVQKVPWWCLFCARPQPPFPYGYLVRPDGRLDLKLLFRGRTLQPYGAAEDPEDGALAVTFYQGPMLEFWEPGLGMAWNYHELSDHPTLPFFLPPALSSALGYAAHTLAVPFDIMDVMNDKGGDTAQLRLYARDAGKRVEVFYRRQFAGLNLPHSMAMALLKRSSGGGEAGSVVTKQRAFLFAAGLQEWIWEEGRGRGMWLIRDSWQNETSPVRLNAYELIKNPLAPEMRAEAVARWAAAHPSEPAPPTGDPELDPFMPSVALRKLASYSWAGICRWPLFTLVKDPADGTQLAVTACYDDAWLQVLRLTDATGRLLPAAEIITHIDRPYGIARIGAVVADVTSGGSTIALLDRGRSRVYSAPFPFPAGRYSAPAPAGAVAGAAADDQRAAGAALHDILGDGEGLPDVKNVDIPLP